MEKRKIAFIKQIALAGVLKNYLYLTLKSSVLNKSSINSLNEPSMNKSLENNTQKIIPGLTEIKKIINQIQKNQSGIQKSSNYKPEPLSPDDIETVFVNNQKYTIIYVSKKV